MPAPRPCRLAHRTLLTSAAALVLLAATPGAQAPATPQAPKAPTFSASVETVYVNVIVRDKSGQPVRGLKAEDFVITEDGKPQALRTFAYEEVVTQAAAEPDAPSVLAPLAAAKGKDQPAAPAATAATAPPAIAAASYHGRRLMVLF